MIYMLIGLPGSGKSTWAKKQNMPIVSSDSIRERLHGDASVQANPKFVFGLAHDSLYYIAVRGRENVIFDATNVEKKYRVQLIDKFNKYNVGVTAIVFDTPVEECIRRQELRERKVPEYAIRRMARRFDVPTVEEGFREIIWRN